MKIEWDDIIENAALVYTETTYAFRKRMTFANYIEYIKNNTMIQMTRDTISCTAIGEKNV